MRTAPCLQHLIIAARPLTATAMALCWGVITCVMASVVGGLNARVAAIGGR